MIIQHKLQAILVLYFGLSKTPRNINIGKHVIIVNRITGHDLKVSVVLLVRQNLKVPRKIRKMIFCYGFKL